MSKWLGPKPEFHFFSTCPNGPKSLGWNWALCEGTSGYCLCFQLYKGKSDTGQEHGLAYHVVMDLMDGYTKKNHHLYADNFYTSPKLFLDVEAKSPFCCGTVRMDRGKFLQQFKTAKLQCEKSILLKTWNMIAIHCDKHDVFVMSTIHGSGNVEFTQRREEQSFQKPAILNDYNKFIAGVDQCYQLWRLVLTQTKISQVVEKSIFSNARSYRGK